ncbi:MAG: 4'-phosphopantetheinyl transferase superfamily protein, partial [Deltaproteobacteria bacterium]|nr:4'-phosphopantetheinyl transferase superfamily protein [Deltaproteobacteria bacterium]
MEHKRKAFIAARGFLREVLGAYLDIVPREVEFVYGEFGKPALRNPPSLSPLYFNTSYSGEVVLVGISAVAELGVDIEYQRDGLSFGDIAKNFFSPGETGILKLCPALERKKRFYECWTMKEAVTKALGAGLKMALDSFEVDFTSSEGSSLSSYNGAVDISPYFTL